MYIAFPLLVTVRNKTIILLKLPTMLYFTGLLYYHYTEKTY